MLARFKCADMISVPTQLSRKGLLVVFENSLPQSFFENTNLTKFKQSVSSFNHSSVNLIIVLYIFSFIIFS